jgi:hypothetical protein
MTVPTPDPTILTGRKTIFWKVVSSALAGETMEPTNTEASKNEEANFLNMLISIS